MTPRIQLITTFYPEFLNDLYAEQPGLEQLNYERQLADILESGFGVADAYARGLRRKGWKAEVILCNADPLQAHWAKQRSLSLPENLHDRRRNIVAAQVNDFQPDVILVFEWSPLGDAFLADMKRGGIYLAGQMASPLRPERTYEAYDLMLSSWPPIVDHFRNAGIDGEHFRLGFDPRVLDRIAQQPPRYDVSFVGGFAPSHPNRVEWLEQLLRRVDVNVFGYGLERVPEDSPIRNHHHGDVWGWKMYETLQQSRITLNLHAINDVRGQVATDIANNLRLYEATGVGTCLFTEAKSNLGELFTPDEEVVTFHSSEECIEKIAFYLKHSAQRETIAASGQKRTLLEHTWDQRMEELAGLLEVRLANRRARTVSVGSI